MSLLGGVLRDAQTSLFLLQHLDEPLLQGVHGDDVGALVEPHPFKLGGSQGPIDEIMMHPQGAGDFKGLPDFLLPKALPEPEVEGIFEDEPEVPFGEAHGSKKAPLL